jgi:hypothetical protein
MQLDAVGKVVQEKWVEQKCSADEDSPNAPSSWEGSLCRIVTVLSGPRKQAVTSAHSKRSGTSHWFSFALKNNHDL